MIDLVGDRSGCGPDCESFIDKWSEWWATKTREPLAILECDETYLQRIGGKSRNMVSKANRLYYYKRVAFNEHTYDIESVARSVPVRQGMPMIGWYTEDVKPSTPARLCPLHSDEWYLGFRREDHTCVSFARIEILNELGILNSILGDPSAGAAVNGLIAHLVEQAGVRWINYLFPQGKTQTLTDFKRRVGFRPMLMSASRTPVAGLTT